jgi:hypothetical protein
MNSKIEKQARNSIRSGMTRRRFVFCAGAGGLLLPVALSARAGPGQQDQSLADFELRDDLTFRFGEILSGVFHGGTEYGIELTKAIDGESVTQPACMNLEHYYSVSQVGGLFAPRKGFQSIRKIDNRTVRVDIGEQPNWKVTATVTYTLLPECTIETEYEFRFGADYRQFDTLLSNCFEEATLPYVRMGGSWRQLTLSAPKEHRFWWRTQKGS